MRNIKKNEPGFVVCLKNEGYAASLERHKIYRMLPDPEAEKDGDIRIIDESGEDYLYAAERFIGIDLSGAVESAILKRAS